MTVPIGWTVREDEISAGVFRIVALAKDGRRIEVTGFDGDRLQSDVMRSIAESDEQVFGESTR